jgi:hypothetical protein
VRWGPGLRDVRDSQASRTNRAAEVAVRDDIEGTARKQAEICSVFAAPSLPEIIDVKWFATGLFALL